MNEIIPRELLFRQIQEKDSEEEEIRKELDNINMMELLPSRLKATANEFTKESRAIEIVRQNGENENVEDVQLPRVYSVKRKSTKKIN